MKKKPKKEERVYQTGYSTIHPSKPFKITTENFMCDERITNTDRKVKVRGWAIYCKTLPEQDAIVDIQFIGISDEEAKEIKLSKKMFVNENSIPNWKHKKYKLIPCTITYKLPARKLKVSDLKK